MDSMIRLIKILRDKNFWKQIVKRKDRVYQNEIELAKRDERFNHCNYQELITYIDKQNDH